MVAFVLVTSVAMEAVVNCYSDSRCDKDCHSVVCVGRGGDDFSRFQLHFPW